MMEKCPKPDSVDYPLPRRRKTEGISLLSIIASGMLASTETTLTTTYISKSPPNSIIRQLELQSTKP